MFRPPFRRGALVATLLLVLASAGVAAAPAGAANSPVTLRLGYFPNVTHAPALVGVGANLFGQKLGPNVDLQLRTFNSGTEELQAFQAGALDAGYIGPSPTITAWTQLHRGVRVVSGAASGGAYFVVQPSINSAADLKGKAVASPQLGNTQDVALRVWLKSKGLSTDATGGGDVHVVPQDNATTLNAFKAGQIAGAWVPEPWATRLINEGGGKILVNESKLWPGGRFVTTQLVVTTAFLKAHRDVVKRLVAAQVAANDYIRTNQADAESLVAKGIQQITGKAIAPSLVSESFTHIEFTDDPVASSLVKNNRDLKSLGLPSARSLKGVYDLSFLNAALKSAKEPTVRVPSGL